MNALFCGTIMTVLRKTVMIKMTRPASIIVVIDIVKELLVCVVFGSKCCARLFTGA
jgi:hypothetical protein